MSNAAAAVFISYRRQEANWLAGWLHDRLAAHFGEARVLLDIDWIKPGVDFMQVITEAIARSRVLLVIIGPQWLASDGDGRLRLDKPDDPVRVEIETAFRREIRVIPLVVDGATMPRAGDLPDALAGLARLNALPVGYQSSRSDVSMGSGDHLRVCLLVSTCVVVTWSPGSQWEGHPRRCRMTR